MKTIEELTFTDDFMFVFRLRLYLKFKFNKRNDQVCVNANLKDEINSSH